jgi:hypothetical protein
VRIHLMGDQKQAFGSVVIDSGCGWVDWLSSARALIANRMWRSALDGGADNDRVEAKVIHV